VEKKEEGILTTQCDYRGSLLHHITYSPMWPYHKKFALAVLIACGVNPKIDDSEEHTYDEIISCIYNGMPSPDSIYQITRELKKLLYERKKGGIPL
jgi:hypothetical protein